MTKICKQCLTRADDSAAFCDSCGAALPLPDVCPSCGAHYLPGAVFCTHCGLRLPTPTVDLGKLITVPVDPAPEQEVGEGKQPVRSIVMANYVYLFPSGRRELIIGRADPEGFTPDIDTSAAGGEAAGVSRRHARITLTDTMAFIEDLGSMNFTYVNRQQLHPRQPCQLNPGDEIQLGRFVMHYQVEA